MMSPSQTALYFREWGLARAWFIAHGIDAKQVDAKRHELHVAALGKAKSSKAFSNADLDKVLGKFRAVHDGGNLDAQLAAEESPEERRRGLIEACDAVVFDYYQLGDNRFADMAHGRRYINGTARNVIHKELEDCDASELAKVLGCLRARLRRMRTENPTKAAELDATRARVAAAQPF